MEVQTQIVEETAAFLGSNVSIGPLPANGGVTLNVASGGTDDRYFAGGKRAHITLQLLCKSSRQQAYNTLCALCNRLERVRNIPPRAEYQLLGYKVESGPQFVEIEGDMAIYTAVVYAYYHISEGLI